MSAVVKGKIVITLFEQAEPGIVFEGRVDGTDLQSIRVKLQQDFHLKYQEAARQDEILHQKERTEAAAVKKVQADKEKEIQLVNEKKAMEAKKLADKKADDERHKLVVEENKKLEAERIKRDKK